MERLVRSHAYQSSLSIELVAPGIGERDRFPHGRSEERSDLAPGEIDDVHTVGKGQVLGAARIPAIAAVSKLSRKLFSQLLPGRTKTVRSKAAERVMELLVVTKQAASRLVVVPNLLARFRIVQTFQVETPVVSVAPVQRRLHGAVQAKCRAVHGLADQVRRLLPILVGPGADRADSFLEWGV